MALESGGYAEKLGNRYEGRWVVFQMLHVLSGELKSVTLETVGPMEAGVDLWVCRRDGINDAQQCKAELASKAAWTFADLDQKGVLSYLKKQLTNDPAAEFTLVSSTPAPFLRDFCRSAKDSTGSPESFYQYQVLDRSGPHRSQFSDLSTRLGLDPVVPQDLRTIYDLLRRTNFHIFSDDYQTKSMLRTLTSLLVDGEPEAVIASLALMASENIRKTLYVDQIASYLRGRGFFVRDLSQYAGAFSRIKALEQIFSESIRPHLVKGGLIERHETSSLIESIHSQTSPRIIFLHGSAGSGKSGILYEFAQKLNKEGVPHLSIRLDRQVPTGGSPRTFGEQLDLPDSPVRCLQALANGRECVLILDQLDAMRWTGAHAAQAFPICQELVRQALLVPKMHVVLGCRTFDLKHDPQIAAWTKEQKGLEVLVGDLPEASVRKTVTSLGADFDQLGKRTQSLLRSVQNLAMWAEIRSTDPDVPSFSTVPELAKRFWVNRRQALYSRGISDSEINAVLAALVDYMDQEGKLWAPERAVNNYVACVSEMCSLNVIQLADKRVTFCHQTYLDFHISERVLRDLDAQQRSVVEWLGAKDRQSLFRREQLRLVLQLLREEGNSDYSRALEALLNSTSVRFHLKQLVLQFLGNVDLPTDSEVLLVVNLLGESGWRAHLVDQVLMWHPQWFIALHKRRVWREWLDSNGDRRQDEALWVIKSVASQCALELGELFGSHIGKNEQWKMQLASVLSHDASNDSNLLFESRCALASEGYLDDIYQWGKLAADSPLRCLRLMKSFLLPSKGRKRKRKPRLLSISRGAERRPFLRLALKYPKEVWESLCPVVQLLSDRYRSKLERGRKRYSPRWKPFRRPKPPVPVMGMLLVAARLLGRTNLAQFLDMVRESPTSKSRYVEFIVMRSLIRAPLNSGELAINWILEKSSRLRASFRRDNLPWGVTRRIIQRFSCEISDELFAHLESVVCRFHTRDEVQDAKDRKDYRPEERCNQITRYGQAHLLLLIALCERRRSLAATGLLGVASRKFANRNRDFFTHEITRDLGGSVISPIRPENLHRVRDRSWLKIILADLPRKRGMARWRQVGPNSVAESSVEMFASSFGAAAMREPGRFARVAKLIPSDAPSEYLAAVIRAVGQSNPPADLSESDRLKWIAATAGEIEEFLVHPGFHAQGDHATVFCDVVERRPDANWSKKVIGYILDVSCHHSDPEEGDLHLRRAGESEVTTRTYEENAINCTRGRAAGALEKFLFCHPDRLSEVQHGLTELMRDPHPSVRVAAIGVCLPILNCNRDLAIELFMLACNHSDDRVLACRDGIRFVGYASHTHVDTLNPVIVRMIRSEFEYVRKMGSQHVAAQWILRGVMAAEFDQMLNGDVHQREGVASVLADLATDDRYRVNLIPLLKRLLEDPEKAVRTAARAFVRDDASVNDPAGVELLTVFTASQAFADDPTPLLWTLERYKGALLPLQSCILGACKAFCGPLAEKARDYSTGIAGDITHLAPVLLRLYEQADSDSGLRSTILDAWDNLLEQRVGVARDLVKAIDE